MKKVPDSQESIFSPAVFELDEARGVADFSLERVRGVDPEKRITLLRLARSLGHTIEPRAEAEAHSDPALDIYRKNFKDADTEALESGLYIPRNDPRYSKAELLVTVSTEPCHLDLPGIVPHDVGVVFPREEFSIVARSAKDLSRHVRAKTRRANGSEEDRDEVEARVNRSAAHAMEGKLKGINELDNYLIDERKLLFTVLREARSLWAAHYKAKNLDKKRKQADELIHNAAETASINLNLGTVTIRAMHRAIASNLYRRGSSRELRNMWQKYLTMTGRYTNARRGKVSQSKSACEKEFAIYAPSLSEA